jgi:hypothetical protein
VVVYDLEIYCIKGCYEITGIAFLLSSSGHDFVFVAVVSAAIYSR